MRTAFFPVAPVIALPGSDSLNTMKLVVPGKVPSGLGGRVILFHTAIGAVGDVVGVKEVTVPLISEVPRRDASRSPSRPAAAPVARVKGKLMPVIVVGKVVTDPDATSPLMEETAAPKPTLPVTVIRTGG